MGDINQWNYVGHFLKDRVVGPVLEIGSKDYGNTQPFRKMFPACEYMGLDLEDGPGVDRVIDLTKSKGDLENGRYQFCICCSVLEHTPTPWNMARHITDLMAPGGILYIQVPWVWRYHMYPDDYFRYSFRGVMSLFPEFSFDEELCYYSTTKNGEFIPGTPGAMGPDNAMAVHGDGRKYLPYLAVNMTGVRHK